MTGAEPARDDKEEKIEEAGALAEKEPAPKQLSKRSKVAKEEKKVEETKVEEKAKVDNPETEAAVVERPADVLLSRLMQIVESKK